MQTTPLAGAHTTKQSVTLRFARNTLKGEFLGFEAYAWVAQRVTGIILLVFFLFHLSTLSTILGGEEAYNQTMRSLNTPLIKAGELLLLWVILFHGLNGFRLIIIAIFPETNHKTLAYSVSLFSIILCILSFPIFF